MRDRISLHTALAFGVGLLAALALSHCATAPPEAARYEVWAADQNGNVLYFLDADGNVLRTLDGAALGDAKRPHMLWGVPGDEFVYSANSVSNSITVLGKTDGLVKTVITGVGKLPHAAQPNPRRPDRIYVSNIGVQETKEGKTDLGETLTEIVRSSGPRWEIARRLDLKTDPALADTNLYPSRRPVCAGFSNDGRYMLVTLFHGGLAAVDLDRFQVEKSWGNNQIAMHGCGFAPSPSGDEMYVTAGDMTHSWLYVFDVTGEPRLVTTHDLSAAGQDAHGVVIDQSRRTLWVVHRVSGNITVHPLATIRQAGHAFETIASVGKAPDLISISPDHRRAFVTLRGPKPAPTMPHSLVGETPGVSIIDVAEKKVLKVVKLGDQELGDFHGVFIPASQR